MLRRPPLRPLPAALLLASALGACATRDGAAEARQGPVPSASPAPGGSRDEEVGRLAALAAEGARVGGTEGAALLASAAAGRVALFRLRGVEADALEALELLRRAGEIDWPGACSARIDHALLDGERRADPAKARASLEAILRGPAPRDCAERARAALATLEPFAPEVAASASSSPPAPRAPVASSEGAITSVRAVGGKDAARAVIAITRPSPYKILELPASGREGPRVAIDVAGAEYEGPASLPGDGLIERMRLAPRDGGTRIVLDLARPATPRAFYVPEPFRLVVDLSDEARPVEAARGPRRVRRIVLDPGHGGHDPGAQGAGGLREKDVVLDVAHRAAPLVARELGVSALLTRDGDEFVPLEERVARANAFSADLFVSIHCNASENAASHGVMTFVLDSTRDDVALRVAARENAASPEAAAELATSLGRALDPAALARSAHFAGLLQRSAVGSLAPRWPDVQDLGVRSAGFYVLAGARMPAALFEASFISHPVEERRLDTGDYRQKLADAIVNAVRAYREGL